MNVKEQRFDRCVIKHMEHDRNPRPNTLYPVL